MEEPRIPPTPPPRTFISITPKVASTTIHGGQSLTINFTLGRENVIPPVDLAVGTVPAGITADVNPPSLPQSFNDQEFSLTLTAAADLVPMDATITVEGKAPESGSLDYTASSQVSINCLAVAQARPAYQLLTVLYAPPGTNGGKSSSKVEYSTGSTTGTKVSIGDSFKESADVTASLTAGIGVQLGVNTEFTASMTSDETSSISVNKSTNIVIDVPGPGKDGIDHGEDEFLLWVNPLLYVTIDHQNNISWTVGVDGEIMEIQRVYADWLKDASQMPAGVADALGAAGLTDADYAQILAADPFSSGDTTIDPNRFVPIPLSFPYEPPDTSNDQVTTQAYTLTSSTTVENANQVQYEYGVGVTLTASAKIVSIFEAQFKVGGSMQFTNTSTSTQTTGSAQSASATIGGPAFGYSSPLTDVLVYRDTLYNSFMFAFATGNPTVSGTLTDSAGEIVGREPVTLTVDGVTFRTFTNSRGEYRFYGTPQSQGTISRG